MSRRELARLREENVRLKSRLDKLAPLEWSPESRELYKEIGETLGYLEFLAVPGGMSTREVLDLGHEMPEPGIRTRKDRNALRRFMRDLSSAVYKATRYIEES